MLKLTTYQGTSLAGPLQQSDMWFWESVALDRLSCLDVRMCGWMGLLSCFLKPGQELIQIDETRKIVLLKANKALVYTHIRLEETWTDMKAADLTRLRGCSVKWLHFSTINPLVCMFISPFHPPPDTLSSLASPLFSLTSIPPQIPRGRKTHMSLQRDKSERG